MLSGCDEIITYGLDSTLGISRKKMPLDVKEMSVEPEFGKGDQAKKIKSIKIRKKVFRKTVYTVVNHSADMDVPRFYIDHNAGVKYGGFVITTEGDSKFPNARIKNVTGFSRYMFRIAKNATLVFEVDEHAFFTEHLNVDYGLETFIEKRMPKLVVNELMDPKWEGPIRKAEASRKQRAALSTIFYSRSWIDRNATMLPVDIVKAVSMITKMKESLKEHQSTMQVKNAYQSEIFKNQERLRLNIKSMEKMAESPLLRRYMQDLDKEEDQLIATRELMSKLKEEEKSLTAQIGKLTLDMEKMRKIELQKLDE